MCWRSSSLKAKISGLAGTRVDLHACECVCVCVCVRERESGRPWAEGSNVRLLSELWKQAISRLRLGSVRWT